jgi:glycerol-3-phosphate dehydrogenase (NAD(P)+)
MKFVVVGAGAWGTAFALHVARSGHGSVLVPRRTEQARAMAERRVNVEYLADIPLPASVVISSNLDAALAEAEIVLLACPAQALRDTCARIQAARPARSPLRLVISLAKGLELGTHLRPTEVMMEVFPETPVGSLTGPTNALEVARSQPAAMVMGVGPADAPVSEVQCALSTTTLRVYTSDDLAGVEYGGCLKNIYAIAAGCCDGLKLGDNTKAALLTRALAEMVRVGVALGARAETFYGLSGFGDLIATCYGGWSRNREFGQRIGEGHGVGELIAHRKTVVEGHETTKAFAELCTERGLDAPILGEMHAILFEGRMPSAALAALMTRGLKRENAAAG